MMFARFSARPEAVLRRVRPVGLFVMLALVLVQGLAVAPAEGARISPIGADLDMLAARAQQQGTVRLIVGLNVTGVSQGSSPSEAFDEANRQRIDSAQQGLLQRMAGRNVRANARFQSIPFIGVTVDADALEALRNDPAVSIINEDHQNQPALKESIPLIGGAADGSFGTAKRTGAEQTVAILDTGVMKSHTFLANKVVSEACYSTTSAANNTTAFCTSGSAPGSGVNCPNSITGCDHGTHVAGIVGGKGSTFNGVAKDVKFIAMQVFSRVGTSGLTAFDTDIIKGLERVYAIRATYKIASVNMSLGNSVSHATNCDSEYAAYKSIIDKLAAAGIATIIASGNNGFTGGVSAPSCVSSAITVGSSTKSDTVSSFSNSGNLVDLLAPGHDIWASVASSTSAFGFKSGTSMATPHVAGAWAVIKQQKPDATVAQVLTALQNTGKAVVDSKNGLSKKRIMLAAAVNTFPTLPNPVPVMTSISPTTMDAGNPQFTLTVTGQKFLTNSVVRWKGVARPTTYMSATQLKATISKTDIAAAGTAAVTVFNPAPAGGTSAAATFTIAPMKVAPAPKISVISPTSRPAGSAAFTLIVKSATNTFVPRSIVRWAGVARTTTYVSPTELRASISAADVATQGTKAVTVLTAQPSGTSSVSNGVNFTVTAPPATTPCTLDEPNNNIAGAQTLPLGATRTYAICTIGDKDFIKLTGNAGDAFIVDGFNPAASLDLVIEGFEASGVSIGKVDTGLRGDPESAKVTFSSPGSLYIALYHWYSEGSSSLTYNVRVTVAPPGSGNAINGTNAIESLIEGAGKNGAK